MKLNLKLPSKYSVLVFLLIFLNLILVGFLLTKRDHPIISANPNNSYPELVTIKDQNWDFRQLSNFFSDLAKKKGGEYAYKALAYAANDAYLPGNIDTHLLGHVVGDELFKQEGINGIKVCTNDLRNACSHSIVVGALLQQGPGALPKIVDTCHLAPGGSGAYTMCVHGLGHGVLAYENYDMKKAVDLCEKTGTKQGHYSEGPQCIGGVTMEMVAGVHDPVAWAKQKDNYLKPNDPLAPCDSEFLPANAKGFCYTYLTPHLFEAAGADLGHPDPKYFHQAMMFCDKISKLEVSNRSTCFGSFGKEFVVLANARNVESVVNMTEDQLKLVYDWCVVGKVSEATAPCVDSALQSLYWGGENDRHVSIRFCNIVSDTQIQSRCFSSLISDVSYYIQDQAYRKQFCQEIPANYLEQCQKALIS